MCCNKTTIMSAAITAAMTGLALGAIHMSEPPVTAAATGATESRAVALNIDTIKALAGTWVALDEEGHPTDEVVSVYRTTAGGSAVLETLFPGTEHEMLTVYHMDRGDLVLTHYCVMGNEPRMTARQGEGGRQLVFECADCDATGTNINSDGDGHMHKGVITFKGDDRISSQWYQHVDGEIGHTVLFELARQAKADKAGR